MNVRFRVKKGGVCIKIPCKPLRFLQSSQRFRRIRLGRAWLHHANPSVLCREMLENANPFISCVAWRTKCRTLHGDMKTPSFLAAKHACFAGLWIPALSRTACSVRPFKTHYQGAISAKKRTIRARFVEWVKTDIERGHGDEIPLRAFGLNC